MIRILTTLLSITLFFAACTKKEDAPVSSSKRLYQSIYYVYGEDMIQTSTYQTTDNQLGAVIHTNNWDSNSNADTLLYKNGRLYAIGYRSGNDPYYIRYEFVYENDKIIKVYDREYEVSTGAQLYDSIVYNAAGVVSSIYKRKQQNGITSESGIEKFTWDNNGNLLELITGQFLNNAYVYGTRIVSEYDSHVTSYLSIADKLIGLYMGEAGFYFGSTPLKVTRYSGGGNSPSPASLPFFSEETYTYTYDEENDITSCVGYVSDQNGNKRQTGKFDFKYIKR